MRAADEESTFTPAITGVVGLYPSKQLQEKYKIQASGVRELGIHTPHPPQRVSGLGLLRVFIPHD